MSLNQVELNEIVFNELNQYYRLCSVPPVQHHFDEWVNENLPANLRGSYPFENVEQCWKNVWMFRHWYMQKNFGTIVDELMKITLQPDAFRYYVLRYRNEEGRPASVKNSRQPATLEPNIETSEPSNPENAPRSTETGQISTITTADSLTGQLREDIKATQEFYTAMRWPQDHQAPTTNHQAPAGEDLQTPADFMRSIFPGIVMNEELENLPAVKIPKEQK